MNKELHPFGIWPELKNSEMASMKSVLKSGQKDFKIPKEKPSGLGIYPRRNPKQPTWFHLLWSGCQETEHRVKITFLSLSRLKLHLGRWLLPKLCSKKKRNSTFMSFGSSFQMSFTRIPLILDLFLLWLIMPWKSFEFSSPSTAHFSLDLLNRCLLYLWWPPVSLLSLQR